MPHTSLIQKLSLSSNKRYLAKRDPPTAPDGLYDWQAGDDAEDNHEANSTFTNIVNTVNAILRNNQTAPHSGHVVRCF